MASQPSTSQTLEKVDALYNKIELLQYPLPPSLIPDSSSIAFDFVVSQNAPSFCDRTAYGTPFATEMDSIAEMENLLIRGETFISTLYTYRSCSKALPMLKTNEAEDLKREIHSRTFQILRPEVTKLNEFKNFVEFAIRVWFQNLSFLVKPEYKHSVPSEAIYDYLILIIDMLIKLDALKDMKACLLNDFARYKRAFHSIRAQLSEGEAISEEIQSLHMFLGNPEKPHNYILWRIKTETFKVNGSDDVIVALMEQCMKNLDLHRSLSPDLMHCYYRVLIHLVYLLDSPDEAGPNVFKHKKISISHVSKLFQTKPILPLYGDMQINIEFVLERCTHWDSDMKSSWILSNKNKLDTEYSLVVSRLRAHQEYTEYTCRLQCLLNELNGRQLVGRQIPQDMLRRVFDTVIGGFMLLSIWNSRVREQISYKYANPVPHSVYLERGGKASEGSEYEKELYALSDYIGIIKGLGAMMKSAEVVLAPILRRSVHDSLQDFVQTGLARPLRKAYKRKRNIKETMLQMRELAADWLEGKANTDDYRQRKAVLVNMKHDYPRRVVAPTLTQITLIRRMMHTIFSDKAPGMQGGLFSEKDLKKEWIEEWTDFYNRSFFFKYVLDYSYTVNELINLSFLWFREFYLEMTKCVQFPIEMSMPWILIEYNLQSPALRENLLFPIDIYNDAAERSLTVLAQQFLYDEIEAEVNLAFDQLVYNLAEKIFIYYKKQASLVLMDKMYKTALISIKKAHGLAVSTCRYWSLLEQQNVCILGRSVDLRTLLGQHLNNYIRQNLEFIIARFEASDLTNAIEFESLLLNLSEHVVLDDFRLIFNEINDDVSIGCYRNRIVVHFFSELIGDLLSNFCYNNITQRFVRGPVSFVDPVHRDAYQKNVSEFYWFGSAALNKYYFNALRLAKGFFGSSHLDSILRCLDYTDIPLVIDECIKNVESKISYVLSAYAKVLIDALPPLKIPDSSLRYGVVGAFGFFEMKLKYIASYDVLRSDVFQCLREIGNAFAFLHLVEGSLSGIECFAAHTSAFYFGVKPVPIPTGNISLADDVKPSFVKGVQRGKEMDLTPPFQRILNQSATLLSHGQNSVLKSFKDDLNSLIDRVLKITPQIDDLMTGSVFTATLQRTHAVLNASVATEWVGKPAANGLIDIEMPKDFARLANALLFIFCMKPPAIREQGAPIDDEKEERLGPSDIEMFGDGWTWCICTLLYLLNLRGRFELLDFIKHIINLQTIQPADLISYKKIKRKKWDAEQQMLPLLEYLLKQGKYMEDQIIFINSILESYFSIESAPVTHFHCTDDNYRQLERKLGSGAMALGAGHGNLIPIAAAQATVQR